MGAVGEQLEHLEKAQVLIERGPIAFLAALLALGLVALAALWVRALLRVEKLQRFHAKELHAREQGWQERFDAQAVTHAARMDEMQRESLERAIKLEHVVQGVLRLVTFGGEVKPGEVKPRRRRRPRTNPSLALEPDAPTQVLEEEVADDDE